MESTSFSTQLQEWLANPLYAALIAALAAALLASVVAAIWRRSFMWLIGMFILVIVVTIPLQLFTTQLAPAALRFGVRLETMERFLWINALPCGLIFLVSLYVVHLARKETQWTQMEAEAIAAEERKALQAPREV